MARKWNSERLGDLRPWSPLFCLVRLTPLISIPMALTYQCISGLVEDVNRGDLYRKTCIVHEGSSSLKWLARVYRRNTKMIWLALRPTIVKEICSLAIYKELFYQKKKSIKSYIYQKYKNKNLWRVISPLKSLSHPIKFLEYKLSFCFLPQSSIL